MSDDENLFVTSEPITHQLSLITCSLVTTGCAN